jgi:hypothetical protein
MRDPCCPAPLCPLTLHPPPSPFRRHRRRRMCAPQNVFPNATLVRVGDLPCVGVVVNSAFTSVTCTAPRGAGVLPLFVEVGGLTGTLSFAYDPPVVLAVTPSPMDAGAPGTLTVRAFRPCASVFARRVLLWKVAGLCCACACAPRAASGLALAEASCLVA